MGFEALILALFNQGSAAAIALAIIIGLIVVVVGLFLRNRTVMTIDAKNKLVDNSQIVSIQEQLASISTKVGHLEREVHDRATRAEVHALELTLERLDGRMGVIDATLKSVGAGVTRIEDFMLAVSERSIRGRD